MHDTTGAVLLRELTRLRLTAFHLEARKTYPPRLKRLVCFDMHDAAPYTERNETLSAPIVGHWTSVEL